MLAGLVAGIALATGLELAPRSRAQDPGPPAGATPLPVAAPVDVRGPEGVPPTFADLAEAVAPAVVTVRTVTFAHGSRRDLQPFLDLFRPDGLDEEGDRSGERREEAGGSGFLVDPDGLVVTNFHVVEDASRVTVTLDEGREVPARVRGADPDTDLALLQIETDRQLPFLELGGMERLRVGDWVMVIGNPLRLGRTVTVGVVSATGRTLGIMEPSFEDFIQTDAAINFGNSGGPMVDLQGRVVGVATAIDWGAENIGFAVPVSTVRAVIPQLATEGRVRRGYLGVEIEDVRFDTQRAFGLEEADGVLVLNVVPGTPAAAADLRHGDVVLRVDRLPVATTRSLIDYVSRQAPGAEVALDIVREGRPLTVNVRLEERPRTEPPASEVPPADPAGLRWLGIEYQDLTPGLREAHGVPEDVTGVWVVEISPRSPLVDERILPGDVIVEVDGEAVEDREDFERLLGVAAAGSYLRLYVRRFDPRADRASGFFAFARKP